MPEKPIFTPRDNEEYNAKQTLISDLTVLFGENNAEENTIFKISGFTDALETYQKEMIRISEKYGGA